MQPVVFHQHSQQRNQIVDSWSTSIEPSHNDSEQAFWIFLPCELWKAPQRSPGPGVENRQQGPGHQANQQPLMGMLHISVSPFLPLLITLLWVSLHLSTTCLAQAGETSPGLLFYLAQGQYQPPLPIWGFFCSALPVKSQASWRFLNSQSQILACPFIKAVYLVFSNPQFLHL